MDQILIRNARLIDGTGAAARSTDVLVEGDQIAAVEPPGHIPEEGRAQVIDLAGAVLCPGFVDTHSHVDNAPFLAEDDTSKVLQGVTSEVFGNCGFSLAPRRPETADMHRLLTGRVFPPIPYSWHSFGEFLETTDRLGYVTNAAPLVGHNTVRVAVMGMTDAEPDDDQLQQMLSLLDEALEAGAFGLSSGLAYPPGVFSPPRELNELVRRLPDDRPYTSHVRGESTQLTASIEEVLEVGRATGRRVHVSHLKCAGRPQWGGMPRALSRLDAARAAGIDVRQDVYPYTASSTMMTATLPPWAQEGGGAAVLARLRDPTALERLRHDIGEDPGTWENPTYGAGWQGIVVAHSPSGRFDGLNLEQIGERLSCSPFEALVHVLTSEDLLVSMIVHSMDEKDLIAALEHPWTMIGSDGLPPGNGGKPHPRMYGTYPRILARYTRKLDTFTLEEAVRRMTSLPAETFGLVDRGVVAPGKFADLVALDPDTVQDTATFEDPCRNPGGIAWVMLNGVIAAHNGQYLGARTGRRLIPRNGGSR